MLVLLVTSYSLQMVTLYRGFNIAHDGLKQTVDDFMDSIVPFTTPDEGCKRIDAARIAIARAAACSMLVPLVIKSNQQLPMLKRTNGFGSVAVVPTFATSFMAAFWVHWPDGSPWTPPKPATGINSTMHSALFSAPTMRRGVHMSNGPYPSFNANSISASKRTKPVKAL